MAAITTAVVAGAGALMTFYGQQQAGKANKKAAKLNAQDAEINANLAIQKAAEDERQFRLSFKRDQGRNVAAIGASGVKQEGSPLEVLQDNNQMAENDAINIRRGGEQAREGYLRQANMYRKSGKAAGQAANISSAATLLNSAGSTYQTGQKSGAWS